MLPLLFALILQSVETGVVHTQPLLLINHLNAKPADEQIRTFHLQADILTDDKAKTQGSPEKHHPFEVEVSEAEKPNQSFWDYMRNSAVAGAILAAAASIFCSFYYPMRQKLIETRLAFVEKQLHELYGPLLAECIHSDSVFRKT